MAYTKIDTTDGLYYVYDTDCSGAISGPYKTEAEAKAYCDSVNE